jgi:uncharacterized protein
MAMRRDEVIARLKEAEPDLRARGVAHAAVFGSVARGDAQPDSDIDIMIELDRSVGLKIGLFEYVGLIQAIQDMFAGPVDVSNRDAIRPRVRPSAERDAVYAF